MTEGQLFTGIVKWCKANTETEQGAVDKFETLFVDAIFGKNISRSEWLEVFLPQEKFIPDRQFRRWTSKIIKNNCKEAAQINQAEIENTSSAASSCDQEPGDQEQGGAVLVQQEPGVQEPGVQEPSDQEQGGEVLLKQEFEADKGEAVASLEQGSNTYQLHDSGRGA